MTREGYDSEAKEAEEERMVCSVQCVRDVNETHRKLIQTPIPSPLHLNPHRPEIHRMRYRVTIARDEVGVDGFEEEGVRVFSVSRVAMQRLVYARIYRVFSGTCGMRVEKNQSAKERMTQQNERAGGEGRGRTGMRE